MVYTGPQPHYLLGETFVSEEDTTESGSSSKKVIAIIAAVVLLLLGATGAAAYFMINKSNSQADAPKVLTVTTQDIENTIPVSGTIDAAKSVKVYTKITGPVQQVNVEAGQRVNEGQLLAVLDVSQQERELRTQKAQEANALIEAMTAVENAQEDYNDYAQLLDQGMSPELTSAQAAARSADNAYDVAQREFDLVRSRTDAGRNPDLVSREQAIESARSGLFSASLGLARTGVNLSNNAPIGETPDQSISDEAAQAANGIIGALDQVNSWNDAHRALNEQQQAYNDALARVDLDLYKQQKAVAEAFEVKREANTNLEVARFNVNKTLKDKQRALNQAERQANATRTIQGNGTEALELDINDKDVYAPFSGLVTTVEAEQGKPAAGALLTVVDDSKLLIRAVLKEADIPKIKPGQEVTFTTPATGYERYTGKVKSVSSVAQAAVQTTGDKNASVAQPNPGDSKPDFPVVIEVTGKKDGLLIGGNAKMQIVAQKETGVISVPRDVIFDGDEKEQRSVLVAVPKGEGSDEYTIEKRDVKVSKKMDFDVVISSGLKEGDKVLTDPGSYRDKVGETVTLKEDNE